MPDRDVRVQVDAAQVRAVEQALAAVPNGAARAIPAALNKAAAKARTSISRRVAAGIGAKVGDMKRRVTLRKASAKGPHVAVIRLKGLNVPLVRTAGGRAAQGSSGPYALGKLSDPEPLPHPAFQQTMPSGYPGVFARINEKRQMQSGRYAGKVRQVIREVFAPSPAGFWEAAPGVAADELGKIAADLPAQLQSQIARLLAPKAAKAAKS